MNQDRIVEIQRKIAELKARKPAHTVPAWYYDELDDLEAQLEAAERKSE